MGKDVGVVGLGVMGGNLARNFASRGLGVAGLDRDVAAAHCFAEQHPDAKLHVCKTPEELVAALSPPRRILLMVNAGKPVDAVLESLAPLLGKDDVVIDGGNSLYTDTEARLQRYAGAAWRFVGMGVSGGSEGALLGPSLMPGGEPGAWRVLEPVLAPIAARSSLGACVTWCGKGAAGHFVKMVHNGIEYGDMQLIAETVALMRQGLGWSALEAAEAFGRLARGPLESFLIEITADILGAADPQHPDRPLVDAILDRAGQKGTGRWTVVAAAELGAPIPTIAAAVDARLVSAEKALRVQAEPVLAAPRSKLTVTLEELESALWVGKVASYAQGFALMAAANTQLGYGIVPAEIARIWTGGCIIRARLLERVRDALAEGAPSLLLSKALGPEVRARLPHLRGVVAAAARAGMAVPALAASWGWLEGLATARGSASIIQAQRDYFGSHTYEREDRAGEAVHTDWARLPRLKPSTSTSTSTSTKSTKT